MIATKRKRSMVPPKRPDASPEVCRAVARYRVAMPMGEPHEVDRAVVATLLSFAGQLDHDSAACAGLALLERVRQLLRKLLKVTDRAVELVQLRNAIDYVASIQEILQGLPPAPARPAREFAPVGGSREPARPRDRRKARDPTPEEIAAACAEIRVARTTEAKQTGQPK